MKKNIICMLFTTLLLTVVGGCANNTHASTSAPNLTAEVPLEVTSTPAATPDEAKIRCPKNTPTPDIKITISAAGDCTFGSDPKSPSSVNFYSVYNSVKDKSYFFKKVKSVFANDDLTIVNFEGTLTNSNTRANKKYTFKGNPSYVNILKKGSIEAVAFANNHCRDYMEQSYSDTIKTFKKAGIKYSSYSKVCTYKVKGKKIGMVSVCGLDGVYSSQNYIASGIKKLKKKKADLIIVSIHAGVEHTSTLNATQTDLAHYAVKKGANLVLGHHPHVLQGIERYKGAYIVYSLGNFCFGGNTNPTDKDTMIFQQTFTFHKGKLKKDKNAKIIPCSLSSVSNINNYQPKILKGAAKRRVINRINSYSAPFNVKFSKKGNAK